MSDQLDITTVKTSIQLDDFRYSGVSLTDSGEITIMISSSDFLPYIKGNVPNYYIRKTGAETDIRYKFVFDNNIYTPDLQIFQTEKQILGLICIVDCNLNPNVPNIYKEYINVLSQYPSAICSKCFCFDYNGNVEDNQISSISLFLNGELDLSLKIRTALTQFSGIMVSSLSMMADSIEKSSSGSYDNTIKELDREQVGLFRNANKVVLKMMKQIHKISKNERVTLERQSSENQYFFLKNPYNQSLNMEDFDSGSDIKIRKKSSIDSTTLYDESNDQNKLLKGRIKKLEGDLLFMSGRITEAIAAFRLCIEYAVASDDYLWQGCALEAYASSLFILLDRKTERSFIVALAICPPDTNIDLFISKNDPLGVMDQMFIDAPILDNTQPVSRNNDPTGEFATSEGLLALIKEIAKLFSMAITCYEKNHLFPPLLHSEACLKRAILQLLFDQYTNINSLEQRVNRILDKLPYHSTSEFGDYENVPKIARHFWRNTALEMAAWIHRGWTQAVMSLDLKDLMKLSATIALLFHSSGYIRKEAFFLRQFLLLIQPLLKTRTENTENSQVAINNQNSIDLNTQKRIIECLGSVIGLYGIENSMYFLKNTTMFYQWSLWLNNIAEVKNILKIEKTGILWIGWYHLQTDVLKECISIAETVPSYPHAIAATFRLLRCLSHIQKLGDDMLDTELLGFGFDLKLIKTEQSNLLKYLSRVLHLYHNKYHLQNLDKSDSEKNLQRGKLPVLAADLEDQVFSKLKIFKLVPRVVGCDAVVVGDVFNSLLENIQPHFLNGFISGNCSSSVNNKDKLAPSSLFLHNPGAKKASNNKKLKPESFSILVSGENAYFSATFKNPFSFPLFLNNVQLLAEKIDSNSNDSNLSEDLNISSNKDFLSLGSGSSVDKRIIERSNLVITSILSSFMIPPNSFYTTTLTGIPKNSGAAQIIGIRCTVLENITLNCLLPEISPDDQSRNHRFLRVRKRLISEFPSDRIENTNDSSMLMALTNPISGFTLPITILQPQPKLEITILDHHTQMYPLSFIELNEGEVVPFYLVLQNLGTIPITHFKIKFNELDHTHDSNNLDGYKNGQYDYNAINNHLRTKNSENSDNIYKNKSNQLAFKDIGSLGLNSIFKRTSKSINISTIYPGQLLNLDYTVFGSYLCNGSSIKLTYGYTESKEIIETNDSNLEDNSTRKKSVITHTKETNKNLSIQVRKVIVPSIKDSFCSILPLPLGLNLFDSEQDIDENKNISVIQLIKRLVKAVNNWQNNFANNRNTANLGDSLNSEKKTWLYELQKFLASFFCIASFNVSNLSTSPTQLNFELKLYIPTTEHQNTSDNIKSNPQFILKKIKIIIPGNATNYKIMLPVNRTIFDELAKFKSGKSIYNEIGKLKYEKYSWNKSIRSIYRRKPKPAAVSNKSLSVNLTSNFSFGNHSDESENEFFSELDKRETTDNEKDRNEDDSSDSKSSTPQYIVPKGPKLSKLEILSNMKFSYCQFILLESIRISYHIVDYPRFGHLNPISFLKLNYKDIQKLTIDSLDIKTFVDFRNTKLLSSLNDQLQIKNLGTDSNIVDQNPSNASNDLTLRTMHILNQKSELGFLNTSFHALCKRMSHAALCISFKNRHSDKNLDLAISVKLINSNTSHNVKKSRTDLSICNSTKSNFSNGLLTTYIRDFDHMEDLNAYDSSNLNSDNKNNYYSKHKTKSAYQVLSIATDNVPAFFNAEKISIVEDIFENEPQANQSPSIEEREDTPSEEHDLKKDFSTAENTMSNNKLTKADIFKNKEFVYTRKVSYRKKLQQIKEKSNTGPILDNLTDNTNHSNENENSKRNSVDSTQNELKNSYKNKELQCENVSKSLKIKEVGSMPNICWQPINNHMLPCLKTQEGIFLSMN
ncbi:hypothetical protein BB561_005545 [Smittium simulii]|uniref:Uncharacterized protein n=1 Tax=Smittium simulii TaxID=133385 RepID=A0A2T9Y9U6_9FUNG|nr:hypothetical protein BB561_005545 [Smittium simulii]